MPLTNINWDAQFVKSNGDPIDQVRFDIEYELQPGSIHLWTTCAGGIRTDLPIIARYLGRIYIYETPQDDPKSTGESILAAEIDCEVCAYVDDGRIRYHLLYADEQFRILGYKTVIDSQYKVGYKD